jgi:formylglycine-generating enzyme required for sulfatase activity
MWYKSNSSQKTQVVGTKQPNPWGLYDMHGNVSEWCLDWYSALSYGTDPKGSSSGSGRVLRGGCWGNYAGSCTSSGRSYLNPSDGYGSHGFRLVRTLSK